MTSDKQQLFHTSIKPIVVLGFFKKKFNITIDNIERM